MKYFEIGNRTDTLSLYATAPTKEKAVKLVEDFTGPIAPQQLRCKEIQKEDIPEEEVVFGESTQDE